MWTLSENTLKIVRQLYELGRSNSWLGRSKRDVKIQSQLDQIAAAAETGALHCAAGFLLSSSVGVRNSARHAVTKLISKLTPYDLIHVSEYLASPCRWHVSYSWYKLAASNVVKVAGTSNDEGHTAMLGLLSFHWNGFVRHEAVRHLSKINDGGELPFLLIRQNDWVEPIAIDAQASVAGRINDSYVTHLVRSLRLILHLASFRRRDLNHVVVGVVDLLLNEKNNEILRDVVCCSERSVRRHVVRYGLQKSGDHKSRLVMMGIESEDPIIRLLCCGHLTTVYNGNKLQSVLDKLAADRFTLVRREALRIKAERFPDLAELLWKHALIDSSRSIRELARYYLTRLGFANDAITSIYREYVSLHRERLSGLEGLAEAGDQSDIGKFQELLHHPLPSRRIVAIRGLSRIGKESSIPDLTPLLRDDNHRVVREVRKSFEGAFLHLLDGDELVFVAIRDPKPFVRKNAVAMLADFSKWRSIPWLIAVVAGAETETGKVAEAMIRELCTSNKVFTRPTEQEMVYIQTALSKSNFKVSNSIIALVELELKRFR